MRWRFRIFGFVLLLGWAGQSLAQSVSGSIPSTAGSSCVTLNVDGEGIVGISVTGTWSGTLQAQVAIGGDAAQNVQVTPYSSSIAQSTITANGAFTANAVGATQFQVCGNTVSSGTANLKLNAVKLSANRNAGTGTVSANSGSAGAIANYAAAGGSTTVGPDATLSDSGTALIYSGTTFQVGAGAGASPSIVSSAATTSGFYFVGTQPCISSNATGTTCFDTVGQRLPSTGVLRFLNGTLAGGAVDLGLSRTGLGVAAIGNGTAGDETGLLRAGNACRVTADITLPVNTATNVCSWSLPAVAKAWAWQCQIPWVISAGSGTNTLAIIANPSQTPTAATNGAAEIKTTNTNTATELTTAISASGATTLLTSVTITPAATVFLSSTSGTLLASATAGTFAIQMTAAGTTATAAAKAGATCWLN